VYCGQTVGWIKATLGAEVGHGADHIVLDGDPSSPPPKGAQPLILAHVCCGKMAGWIRMPLGKEVGLGPGDVVLDGNPAPQRGTAPPTCYNDAVAKTLKGHLQSILNSSTSAGISN